LQGSQPRYRLVLDARRRVAGDPAPSRSLARTVQLRCFRSPASGTQRTRPSLSARSPRIGGRFQPTARLCPSRSGEMSLPAEPGGRGSAAGASEPVADFKVVVVEVPTPFRGVPFQLSLRLGDKVAAL